VENLSTEAHIKQIYDELKRQGDSLDKVISSIQGDEAFGTKGMLHRIRENEMSLREQKLKNDKRYAEVQQRTQKNEDRFNSVYNRFMGFGAAITVITTVITLLLNFWGVFDDPKIKYLPMPAQESVQVAPAAPSSLNLIEPAPLELKFAPTSPGIKPDNHKEYASKR